MDREPVDHLHEVVDAAKEHMSHIVVRQVIGDIDYVGINRDDECWWQLQTLEEQGMLPEGITAVQLYNLYRTNYGGEA